VVRIVGSKLCTFIGKRRDPEELLDRLVSAGLLAENVNQRKVLAVIQAAFAAEARRFDLDCIPQAGEVRAHLVLDHRLLPYLSPRGVALMRTPDYWQYLKDRL
jgi:hypothetical protein